MKKFYFYFWNESFSIQLKENLTLICNKQYKMAFSSLNKYQIPQI